MSNTETNRNTPSSDVAGRSAPTRRDSATTTANPLLFYRVPLVCEAAPQIGCGCRSKPVLAALESHPMVERACLNRSGTTVAVQWAHEIAKEEALRVVSDAFSLEGTVDPVTGDEHDKLLQQFRNDADWYGADTIDALSGEEAELIAARIVRRVAKKAELQPENLTELQCAIACASKEVLVNDRAGSLEWRREAIRLAIIEAARGCLDPQTMARVESTLSSVDYRPLNGEL